MIKEDKINSFGLSTMVCALCCSSFYGVFSSYLLHESLNSTIISLILGYFFSLIISKLILSFYDIKDNQKYVSKIKYIYSKTSIIIILISIICSLFGYILLTYRLTTFISNQYLIETPKYLILIMILFTTYFTASKGIETTIRVSTISFYISIIIFLFDFFSLVGQINLQNYLPLFTVSFKKIIINALIFSLYFTITTTQIYAIKKSQIEDKQSFNKSFFIMLTLSFIIIFISTFTIIGVSGINIVNLFDYPVYSTLKRIKIFSFLDSIENVSILAWVYFILNSGSMFLLFIFNNIKDVFKLNKKKSFIVNIIIMILVFSIPNFIFLKNNYNETYEYIYLPLAIECLVLLIIIISLIKNRLKK